MCTYGDVGDEHFLLHQLKYEICLTLNRKNVCETNQGERNHILIFVIPNICESRRLQRNN